MASQRFVDWNAAWIMGRISNMSTLGKDVVMKDATGLTSAQDMRRGNYRHGFFVVEETTEECEGKQWGLKEFMFH